MNILNAAGIALLIVTICVIFQADDKIRADDAASAAAKAMHISYVH